MSEKKQTLSVVKTTGIIKGINRKKKTFTLNISGKQITGKQYEQLSDFIDNEEAVDIGIKATQAKLFDKPET